MRKARKGFKLVVPDIPFTPALSRLDDLIPLLKGKSLPDVAEPTLDESQYSALGKLGLKHDCSPRMVLAAILLCAAYETVS